MRVLPLLVAFGAACGNDANVGKDGGNGDGDAGVDVMADADPNVRGTVTVRLVDRNDLPIAGLHVVFVDTDGAVTDALSDSAGVAVGSVFPGASVTAVRPHVSGDSYGITTVLELNPDDDITLISAAPEVIDTYDPFALRVVPLPSVDVVSAIKPSGTQNATYTTGGPHGFAMGDIVEIADVVPSTPFQGRWTVASTTATTFVANVMQGGSTVSSIDGGSAAKLLPFNVSFPAYGGATSYDVHTPCGRFEFGGATSGQIHLRAGCVTTMMDVLVFAKSSATVELAYAVMPNVAFTAGGNLTVTDSWHALSTVSATYTNPTAEVETIAINRYIPYLRNGATATATATDPFEPTTTLTVDTALAPSAWMQTSLTGAAGLQSVSQKVDGTATAYALDIGANLLPWVTADYDMPSTTIVTTIVGSAPIDLFQANLKWGRGQVIYTWRVFGPIAKDITFPTLPSTLPGDPTVRPTDTQSRYQVFLCESDAIGGYRDAIKNVYRSLATCEMNANPGISQGGGTMNRLSQSF